MRRLSLQWGRPPIMRLLSRGWLGVLRVGVAGSPEEQLTIVCFGPLTIQLG